MSAVLCVLAACSSGNGVPPPRPTTTTSPVAVADVTVRGVVGAVSASARVLMLAPPVSGVVNLALSADTEIVRADGARAGLADVTVGSTVEGTGRPSAPDTLIVRRLVVAPR